MIKIFLVEDEFIIRRNFRENIDWTSAGLEFSGDAADGELALPLILSKKPDILITDIKMPFMDGLQLSVMVKKALPSIRIILLSGYKDFSYAKKAIGIGVEDYLLKPITSEKLIEKIKAVAVLIEERNKEATLLEKYKSEMSEKKQLERNRFFADLISGRYDYQDLMIKAEKLDLTLISQNYALFLLEIQRSGDNYQDTQECCNILHTLEFPPCWMPFDRGIEGAAVICMDIDESTWEIYKKKLAAKLDQIPGIRYFGVLGPSVRRLSELQKSYRAAQKVFSMRFFYNTPNVLVLYSDTDFSKSRINFSPLLDIDSEKLDWTVMERFLKMGTIREIPDYITEFLDSLGTNNLKLSALKRYIVMDIYFCCLTFLQHLGYKKEELTALTSTADLSFAPGTIRPTLEEILTTTLGYRNDRTENRNTKLISKVKDFIQHNYSTDITLNLVAKEAGISPNYLSTLFSTETNKTFIEYLTSVRLEKATELLMCTPMRSSEISYQIGYQDAHYFSYLFKKNFGISPREYRARKSKTKNADD